MKSFISARFFAVLFFVTLFLALLSACGRAEPETIRVAAFYDQKTVKAGEVDTTEINQYLEEQEKTYRLSVEQFANLEDINLSEYDLFLTDHYFTPTQISGSFLDLTEELRTGNLQPLYKAYPEIFWTTVLTNGRIYNLHGSTYTNYATLLTPYQEELSAMLTSYFRIITPYIGIANSDMNMQAICLYESSYMNEIKSLVRDQFQQEDIVLPAVDIHSSYARPAFYPDAQTYIPQDAPHLEAVFTLLNDIAVNLELGAVCQSEITPFTSTDCLSAGTLLEKNWQTFQEQFSTYQEGLLPKFSFDPSSVLAQTKAIDLAIQNWQKTHDSSELDPASYESIKAWSAGWNTYIKDFTAMLYENGLQNVLDEVNRQVAAYIAEAVQ